jgi:hypothetical protein
MIHVVGLGGYDVNVAPASAPDVLAGPPVVPFDEEQARRESEAAAKKATVFFTERSMT